MDRSHTKRPCATAHEPQNSNQKWSSNIVLVLMLLSWQTWGCEGQTVFRGLGIHSRGLPCFVCCSVEYPQHVNDCTLSSSGR